MNNNYIRYYHMDTIWSVGLAHCYFYDPGYLVLQCLIHTTLLCPDSVIQRGYMFTSLSSFLGVGYIHERIICNCIMAIFRSLKCHMTFVCYCLFCSMNCQPLVIIATLPIMCQVVKKHPCNNCKLFFLLYDIYTESMIFSFCRSYFLVLLILCMLLVCIFLFWNFAPKLLIFGAFAYLLAFSLQVWTLRG